MFLSSSSSDIILRLSPIASYRVQNVFTFNTVFKLLSKTLYYVDMREERSGSLELSAQYLYTVVVHERMWEHST